jgi:hypothetical protein
VKQFHWDLIDRNERKYYQYCDRYPAYSRTRTGWMIAIQPHVRPIKRGKARAANEFGAKISVGLVEGYAFLDHLSWDNFNESVDLSPRSRPIKTFWILPEIGPCGHNRQNKGQHQILQETRHSSIRTTFRKIAKRKRTSKKDKEKNPSRST